MTRKYFDIIIMVCDCIGVSHTMKQVINNLREQEYVTADNVVALRKYIRIKNPDISGEELSAVFADALHKIIDTRIGQFEEGHRKRIKDDILRKAVKKREFTINAAEVFTSCLSLKLQDSGYINSFTQWINQNQPVQVSVEKVDKLVSSIGQVKPEYLESSLSEIIEEFESSTAEAEVLQAADEQQVAAPDDLLSLEEPAAAVDLAVPEAPAFSLGKLFEYIHKLAAMVLNGLKYVKPSMKLALPAALPLVVITAFIVTDLFSDHSIHALQHQDHGKYANIAEEQVDRYLTLESRVLKKLDGVSGQKSLVLLDGLHDELRYTEVNEKKLRIWLSKKNSLLAEEPYFSAIMTTSRRYDINPLLMFAVVGQEQAFVPKSGAAARKIANNPFNVYGSWQRYNTDIYDSSSLAADTIIKSSRNRPVYMNSIKWINRRYAEDPNWWNGVSQIFAQMEKEINN